jgi:hypothetical protein
MNAEAIQLAGLTMLLRALPRTQQDDDNIVMPDGTLVPFESAASHLKQAVTTHLQSATIDTFDFEGFIADNYGDDLGIDADSTPQKGLEQFVGSFMPGGN